MTIITQEEIEKLLSALSDKYIIPVIKIKPSEIEEMGEVDKANYKFQFNTSLQVYVKPLEKLVINLLNAANRDKYTYDVADLSILERVALYSSILIKSGYKKEELEMLVPKTEEEVNIIAEAISNGFDDSNILKNEERVTEARNYLQRLSEGIPGRRIA